MNKKTNKLYALKYILVILLVLLFLTGCENSKNDISYNTEKENYTSSINGNNSNQASDNSQNNIQLPLREVASFYTNIYDKSENRVSNLRVAANNLSNTVIKSGETFSFNETMGQSTKSKRI